VFGAVMVIPNISRHCAGVYECEASNGVPPAVSHHMEVTVECKLTCYLFAYLSHLFIFVSSTYCSLFCTSERKQKLKLSLNICYNFNFVFKRKHNFIIIIISLRNLTKVPT